MQTDPILMISLIRQSNATATQADLLLHWLKQASLLCVQSHSEVPDPALIQRLSREFAPILQTLANLGGEPAQQLACQQLFDQIGLFYRELNHYCGPKGSAQQALVMSGDGQAKPAAEQDCATEPAAVDFLQPYNRYD